MHTAKWKTVCYKITFFVAVFFLLALRNCKSLPHTVLFFSPTFFSLNHLDSEVYDNWRKKKRKKAEFTTSESFDSQLMKYLNFSALMCHAYGIKP